MPKSSITDLPEFIFMLKTESLLTEERKEELISFFIFVTFLTFQKNQIPLTNIKCRK